MKKLFNFLAILGLPLLVFSQQTINGTMTHDGKQRSYILYVPANYTGESPVPLVFNFHGYTSNANDQMWYGDFRAIADTAGFLIVHPQGTLFNGSTHWNVGGWTVGSSTDDVGFTAAMIDTFAVEYNVDLNRVYATGMSNGGYMSFLLACQLSDKIAAIASVTGSMTPETFNSCNPQHPMPILQIHGSIDGVVPYNGAAWTEPIEEVMEYWVNYNHCQTTPLVNTLANINILDASTVTHYVYTGGDHSARAEHYRVAGGAHTWPGTIFLGPGTNQDFNASLKIWQFFSQYDLNGLNGTTGIDPIAGNYPKVNIYPNPTNANLHIALGQFHQVDYQLMSILGQRMLSGSFASKDLTLDLSTLPQGMYVLKIGKENYEIVKTE